MIRLAPPRLRVVLVLLTGLALLQFLLAVSAFFRLNTSRGEEFRLPLPDRVAAIVAALEGASLAARPTLLAAIRSEDFDLWIEAAVPRDENLAAYPMPHVADAVDRYVDALGNRDVIAWLAPGEGETVDLPRFERFRLWSDEPMRLAVSLNAGEWLMIETRGNLPRQVFGFPPGLWAGLTGVLVGALSLLTLWRGLGPLEGLSRRVEAFAADQTPEPLPLKGPREARRVAEAINTMQTEIARLLSERRAMFAAMSHDLRTYLTRLRLRIEGIGDAARRAKAEAELDEMRAIIEESLVFTCLEAATANPVETDLGALLRELAADHDPAVPVTVEDTAADFRIGADPLLFRRVVDNLLINARRHAGGGELVLRRRPRTVEIDVADRGPGIPGAQKARVLQPFERGDLARTLDVPGSGLGLAIASRVMEQHGGTLALIDRDGGGLIVRLTLPL